MPIGDEDVEQTIVVEVGEVRAPSKVGKGDFSHARSHSRVDEEHLAEVLVQRVGVSREVGNEDIQVAVVVVVPSGHSHSRLRSARFVQCRT